MESKGLLEETVQFLHVLECRAGELISMLSKDCLYFLAELVG
jgi:hypothetical protein